MIASNHHPTRVCVTGATGGLGRALVARLATEGVEVVGMGLHPPAAGVGPFRRFVPGDIASVDWPDALDGCAAVFHLAAYVHKRPRTPGDERRVLEVNHEATARLAASCRESGATLLFASTVAVFGRPAGRRYGDDDAVAPETPYARSKWLSEQAIRQEGGNGLRYVILRFPLLHGPHGRGNLERMLRAVARGRYWPIGDPGTRKGCLSLADAAEAFWRAWSADQTRGGTFVVAGDHAPTLGDIHEVAYQAFGRAVPRPSVPRPAALLAARLLDLGTRALGRRTRLADQIRTLTEPTDYDGSRFAALTGFRPRDDPREAIRETALWLRAQQASDPSGARPAAAQVRDSGDRAP